MGETPPSASEPGDSSWSSGEGAFRSSMISTPELVAVESSDLLVHELDSEPDSELALDSDSPAGRREKMNSTIIKSTPPPRYKRKGRAGASEPPAKPPSRKTLISRGLTNDTSGKRI